MTFAFPGDTLSQLEQMAVDAMKRGQSQQALALWARVVELAPQHAAAHTQLAQDAFQRGDFEAARAGFQKAADSESTEPRRWINVALACQRLGDEAGEESALFLALKADPCDLLALLMRGALRERQGRTNEAAQAFGAAATVAPADEQLHPQLHGLVAHAREYQQGHQQRLATFMDEFLAPHLSRSGPGELQRFNLSLDILLGRKQRFDPQPMRYYLPQLPVEEFYDRRHFPWLPEVEAATEDIRREFLQVLEDESSDLVPYIDYDADQPIAQWSQLNHSPDWSVFHLVKDGLPVAEHAQRCPRTMAAWEKTPWPDQPGRTPVSMFSLLKPRTRIPSHVGASNARLVVHLPLIVPEGCRFRVGNSVRPWVPGQAWVFDDTIEHEAFNDSEHLRVVLIFDTWNPYLSPAERALITEMNRGLNAFIGGGIQPYDV